MASAAHIPARAQARATPVADSNAQATASPQGYLGIDIADIDAEKTQALRLKDARGAIITLIDHDAPAGQVGLKVNDVVIQFNGQAVENADQFRRMLKEIPPGRKITLEFSRDGSIQTLTLELADRKLMEKNVWSKLGTSSKGPQPQMGFLGGNTEPSGFHMPSFGSSLKVGALVEPLTAQMAAHLGVDSGLMVKEVTHKSDAEVAGFRAFDVILKVGTDSIATAADWDRALRANQGKPVQVIILRDSKQETLTLQVDSKHRQDKSGIQSPLTPEQQEELVQLESNLSRLKSEIAQQLADQIASEANARATQAQNEAEAMRDRMQGMHFGLSSEAAEQLRRQTEKLRESLKAFQADPKQLKDLQRQMEEFRENFHPDQFRFDPKEMQEFQHRMDDFRHQMEEWSAGNSGHFV
jgi:membrane-associated protease RseP (regulator of RpoE activity)